MTKSEDIIKSMDDTELKVLSLCFSKPKVMEALRIYNKIPGFLKSSFIRPGRIEMKNRGLITPILDSQNTKISVGKANK